MRGGGDGAGHRLEKIEGNSIPPFFKPHSPNKQPYRMVSTYGGMESKSRTKSNKMDKTYHAFRIK